MNKLFLEFVIVFLGKNAIYISGLFPRGAKLYYCLFYILCVAENM